MDIHNSDKETTFYTYQIGIIRFLKYKPFNVNTNIRRQNNFQLIKVYNFNITLFYIMKNHYLLLIIHQY